MYRPRGTFVAAVFAYTVLARVLSFVLLHFGRTAETFPLSFTPIFALCLFGVSFFHGPVRSFGVPLLAWVVGDLLIGVASGTLTGDWKTGLSYAMYPGQVFTYGGFLLVAACGLICREKRTWYTVGGAGLLGAVLFFLVSNFGSWQANLSGTYSRDFNGLMACYVAGLPFLRGQIISTWVFSLILFSPLALRQLEAAEEPAPVTATA